MAKETLTTLQKEFISLFAQNKYFNSRFYLSGGTALSAYYLHHRYSEDLDFFSSEEIDILGLDVFFKQIKAALKIQKTDFQQSFNRNIFFLHAQDEILKTEFTYFPFEQAEKPLRKEGILVDDIKDIAINKIFTITQNARARDFIDLYYILEKYKGLSFSNLIKLARIKFDAQIDAIQLGAQLLKAKNIQDLPRMLKKTDHRQWRLFFIKQAKLLSKEVFE